MPNKLRNIILVLYWPDAINLLNKTPENIFKEYIAETIDMDNDQST